MLDRPFHRKQAAACLAACAGRAAAVGACDGFDHGQSQAAARMRVAAVAVAAAKRYAHVRRQLLGNAGARILAVGLLHAVAPEDFREVQLELLGGHVVGMGLRLDFADHGVAQGNGDDAGRLAARMAGDMQPGRLGRAHAPQRGGVAPGGVDAAALVTVRRLAEHEFPVAGFL
eukprot:gene22829-27381_t